MNTNICPDLAVKPVLREIVSTLGLRPIAPERALKIMFNHHNYAECVREIAILLNLPVKVKVRCIHNRLWYESVSRHGAIAIVGIPKDLPLYVSLAGTTIQMEIKAQLCTNFATFCSVIAHELCHIVLHSLQHPQRQSEIATDLTAMALGFSSLMKKGRVIEEGCFLTSNVGYLSDHQFNEAYNTLENWRFRQKGIEFLPKFIGKRFNPFP